VSAPAAVPARRSGRGRGERPEALLSKTLHEVGNHRLDAAVSEIDKAIRTIPISGSRT